MRDDSNLMEHRPSVIAVAAVLVALDQKLTRQSLEVKINALFPSGFLEIVDVFSCYTRMRDLNIEKIKLPNHMISSILSPIQMRMPNVNENSAKRKRLTFDDNDQNYGTPEEKAKRHG
ncbi:unnamed protein product [Ilex paraguariensis]|uniref:Cyclin C-terminal domain-containing protein n=1 Tax=Ilex paraguariensis TaxID=185542 RepID=A0ABC8SLD3_9AQUA